MGKYKVWTEQEELYLQDNWGSKSVTLISKHLNRPYDGVRRKAAELGLLDPTLHFDGITVRQLMIALGISSFNKTKNWITRYDFPAKQKVFSKKRRIYVVSYEDFWLWAEKHKYLINFSKVEPLILGKEPAWVKEKRKIDRNKRERRPWTPQDKARLISLVNSYRYTYPELATMLKRPESSIKRKLLDLNIKARPLSLDKHIKYTQEEIDTILELLDIGYSLNAIADRLNESKSVKHKSASGIKGKLERMGFVFSGDMPIVNPFKQNK